MKQLDSNTVRSSTTSSLAGTSNRLTIMRAALARIGAAGPVPAAGLGLILAGLTLTGCGSDSATLGTNAGAPGTLHIADGLPSSGFLVEENKAGDASTIRLLGTSWGRLVEIADVDGTLRHKDFVVGEDVRSDNVDFAVSSNPVTDQITVRILHPFGSPEYVAALKRAKQNLTPVQSKGLSPNEIPPFTVVPRNAAIVLRFDDILDPRYVAGAWRDSYNQLLVSPVSGQLKSNALRVVTGNPPSLPFEARIILDPNHGDLYGSGDQQAFYSTRVIIDLTVSETQAAASDPPLATNSIGLPESLTTLQANVAVRIPTRREPLVGQSVILTNPSGKGLAFTGNGPRDVSSETNDVVRAFRSGNQDDINNGFLFDEVPPVLIGSLTVIIEDDDPSDGEPAVSNLGGGLFLIRQMRFEPVICTANLKLGQDVLDQGSTRAIVMDAHQEGALARNVLVQVVAPSGGSIEEGGAQLQTAYEAQTDQPDCFLRFSPNPTIPPAAGVSKSAHVFIRFSKPMDPGKLSAFDSMTITRVPPSSPALTNFDFVVGRVQASADLREFAFVPVLPFDRGKGLPLGTYHFQLDAGPGGPTDLAGNPLELETFNVPFSMDTTESVSTNAGVVLRFDRPNEIIFNSEDELEGWGEFRQGQVLFDLANGRILPRPVNRFSVAADRDKPLPSIMTPFPPGVQTPLSSLGSKLQTLWRYVDVGFSLTDETNINLDVEGLAWAPIGGAVVLDTYNQFSIRLAHSRFLPDEIPDPKTLFPKYLTSGLNKEYSQNYLDLDLEPGAIVHPRERGYTVSPANMFTAESGTFMQPFPLNRGIPVSQFRYFTWRDTSLLSKAGPNGQGATLEQEVAILGVPGPGVPWPRDNVPTVGLPLLMEFRCYPDSNALGLNAFDISLAVNSSARPNFRAFSTGGYNSAGDPVVRNPDDQTMAAGGFNPATGGQTQGVDNSFYIGQMDLVTRVSQVHSIWFDTALGSPKYAQPVMEPPLNEQPLGTQVLLAFRGATTISGNPNPTNNIKTNPFNLNVYGNHVGTTVGQPNYVTASAGGKWSNTMDAIDSAALFQFRVTFISNAETGLTPSLSALGFAYFQ